MAGARALGGAMVLAFFLLVLLFVPALLFGCAEDSRETRIYVVPDPCKPGFLLDWNGTCVPARFEPAGEVAL